MAPARAKGTAIGIFSSVQFFGVFLGATVGGTLYGRWGVPGVVIFNAVLIVIWLVLAYGIRVPARAGESGQCGPGRRECA
jgi:predicted MFS family arabinose efflux permease